MFGPGTTMMKIKPLRFHQLWLVLGWFWVALVIYLSLTPHPPEISMMSGDKIGHMLAYLFLMLWFAQIYRSLGTRIQIAIGLVLLGVAIEFAQEQTGYRRFEVADMGADAIGVGIGLLLSFTPLRETLRLAERILMFR
jgi:VanZ family protein